MSEFIKILKAHLEKMAAADAAFAEKYNNSEKSIDKCASYIISEMKKKSQSGCTVASDAEVYGLAVHYYDENIKMDDAVEDQAASVEISQAASHIELSDEDKAKAKEIAMQRLIDAEKARLQARKAKKAENRPNSGPEEEMPTLF